MVKRDLWAFLPVMDRAVQMLCKVLPLNHRFEAVFEPTSYGFRPLRNAGHATARIFQAIRYMGRPWVFEGDL